MINQFPGGEKRDRKSLFVVFMRTAVVAIVIMNFSVFCIGQVTVEMGNFINFPRRFHEADRCQEIVKAMRRFDEMKVHK